MCSHDVNIEDGKKDGDRDWVDNPNVVSDPQLTKPGAAGAWDQGVCPSRVRATVLETYRYITCLILMWYITLSITD